MPYRYSLSLAVVSTHLSSVYNRRPNKEYQYRLVLLECFGFISRTAANFTFNTRTIFKIPSSIDEENFHLSYRLCLCLIENGTEKEYC